MSLRKFITNIRGDTIVEVLLAIVILSVILTGAYAVSTKSLTTIRQAQERVQAVGVAQTQIEDLRAQAITVFSAHPTYATNAALSFCFDSTNTWQPYSSAVCQFQSIPYTVQITPVGESPGIDGVLGSNGVYSTYGFQISVTWPSLAAASTTNQVVIVYRVAI